MPHIDIKVDQIPIDSRFGWNTRERPWSSFEPRKASLRSMTAVPTPSGHFPGESLTNGILHCPGHGWQFDVVTGRCIDSPVYCLKPVSVVVTDDRVRLEWDTPASERESVDEAIV